MIASKSLNRARRAADKGHLHHQGWYPLALSRQLRPGALLGRDFLGTRVVMRRDAAGKPVIQSGYCPHLGADLSVGELVSDQVRCAFHHWSFNAAGSCTHIPTEGKIPPGARLFTYPSAESWGLVWAFAGPTPLFDPPTVPGLVESDLVYRTELLGLASFEPWLPTSNGLDFQHLRALHGMKVPGPARIDVQPYGIDYSLSFGASAMYGRITGTNTFSLHRSDDGVVTFRMWTGAPVRPGETLSFSVVGMLDPRPTTAEARTAMEKRLDGLTAYMAKLREEDYAVLSTMRFHEGTLVSADRYLSAYFEYVREFPTMELPPGC